MARARSSGFAPHLPEPPAEVAMVCGIRGTKEVRGQVRWFPDDLAPPPEGHLSHGSKDPGPNSNMEAGFLPRWRIPAQV
eukprot:gene19035-biopygen11510